MASPAEMENVILTTLATALMMSDTCDDESAAVELLDASKQAAMKRMDAEMVNTEHHLSFVQAGHATYADALANEKEILNAWRGYRRL